MSEELSLIGKSVPRWQGYEKATGTARYGADTKLPGMLVGKILFSPHAHARIANIDTSKAEQLAGVEAVITWKDVPAEVFNPNKMNLLLRHPEGEIKDMQVLTTTARYVGDRIAAVAAVDTATAERALELIEVTYEELPAVFDPFEAMKPGAPQVHDFAEKNIPMHFDFPFAWGDVEKGYAESDAVVEETFRSSSNHICQMEPCAVVADFSVDGKLTIWSPTQHPFVIRRKLADIFGIPDGSINWITPHVGGAFGKYSGFCIEPVCVALTQKARRPVKIELSREEDLFATERRQKYITTAKMGVAKDGSILALQEDLIVDGGAYYTQNGTTTNVNIGGFLGLYRHPNVAASATMVYTNVPPTGGVRGYGNHEASAAREQLIDIAAAKIGMDPLEMRLRNVKHAGDPSSTGIPMETCPFEEIIRLGAERIGWKEKKARAKGDGPKRYGVGMAIAMDVSGAQPFALQQSNAFLKLNEDGSATLFVNAPDLGQNVTGTMAQIAAEALGLEYDDVHVVNGQTDTALFDSGIHASRGTYQFGNAVIAAAENAKEQLFELAAKALGVPPEELEIEAGRIRTKSLPRKWLSVKDVVKGAIYNFEGEHLHILGKGSYEATLNPPPFQAVFSEVEVDVETGVTKILRILYVVDAGTIINPLSSEGQIEGAIQQSIGYTLTEDYVINDKTGALESCNFNTYKCPGALDMPEIDVVLYEDAPVPSGPFGAKGLAQGAMCAVTPAIANAIYDAVGVVITDMPATSEKILTGLQQ